MLDGRGGVACASCGSPIVGAEQLERHSQYDGERPAGATRDKYRRKHAHGLATGLVGVWSEGRARLMTAEAWAKLNAAPAKAPAARESVVRPIGDEDVLAELGLARRAS